MNNEINHDDYEALLYGAKLTFCHKTEKLPVGPTQGWTERVSVGYRLILVSGWKVGVLDSSTDKPWGDIDLVNLLYAFWHTSNKNIALCVEMLRRMIKLANDGKWSCQRIDEIMLSSYRKQDNGETHAN